MSLPKASRDIVAMCCALAVAVQVVIPDVAASETAAPAVAAAGPVFETLEVKATMDASEKEKVLVYPFRNNADIPLLVERFDEGCGCMAGVREEVPVEVGKNGEIKVKFAPNGLRGKIRKSVTVKFVGGYEAELIGVVDVPEVLNVSERTVNWEQGGEKGAKVVDIKVHSSKPVKVLEAVADPSTWSVKLTEVEAGRHYQVKIEPLNLDGERTDVIQLRTDSKDPRDAETALFAIVGSKKTGGAK